MTREELILANRRLQKENEWVTAELVKINVKRRLGEDPATSATTPTEASEEAAQRAAELQNYISQMRDGGVTLSRQHEELLDLRQRCAFYATAMEETTANFAAMKQLLAELQENA